MTAFLSGEMKDTVEINPAGSYGTCFISWLLEETVLRFSVSFGTVLLT
jgi:hypothetical protein